MLLELTYEINPETHKKRSVRKKSIERGTSCNQKGKS